MPYGPEWIDGQTDDGVERGIIGMFLCSNITIQFYTLMAWISINNFSPVFGRGRLHDQDTLFGNRRYPRASREWNIPGDPEIPVVSGLPDFVRTRGTAFFILPSLRTLSAIGGVE